MRRRIKSDTELNAFFNKVKNYRRLATRYEKTANMFMAFLVLLSIRLWLKEYEEEIPV
ncbi:transposase [Paenibacillus sp. UY79]|nr:transposase [Paenibacillus farraposensis]